MFSKVIPKVIITRPLAQANVLAQQVAAIGREPVIFPLLEIHPLNDPAQLTQLKEALNDLDNYAMAAFVSPNAIDAVFPLIEHWPGHVTIAVMGEGSRAALAQHGVTSANAPIVSPSNPERTDSQTLMQELDLPALKGKRVLIVRGETGREFLADALRAAGAQVEQVAAYRRVAPEMDQPRRTQLLALLNMQSDWIVTSSQALHVLLQMVRQAVTDDASDDGVVKMQQQRLIVPHIRIKETAEMLGFRNITLTGSGDECLLAALQSRP